MSNEQLKMLLDALQSLGAEGKTAFVWWLAADRIIGPAMSACAFVAVVWIVARTVMAVVRYLNPPTSPDIGRVAQAYEAVRAMWLYGAGGQDVEAHKLFKQVEEFAKKKGVNV